MARFAPQPAHPAWRSPRRQAFSLTELILVVVILGIVAAMAVPMLGQTHQTRLRGAADLLIADLAFAQIESIAHGDDPRIVVFDLTNHSYHLAAASDPDTPIQNPATRTDYRTQFGEGRAAELTGVTFASLDVGDDDQLGFGLYGQLDQSETATITLVCNGQTLTLSIDAICGEVTVTAP